MAFSIFVNFNGNCSEAVGFYADVFKQPRPEMMMYSDNHDGSFEMPAGADRLVMYTELSVGGAPVMFCDTFPGSDFVLGNNIDPVVSSTDMGEIRRLFEALSAGGKVQMELQETFWSQLYGMVTDRYGITWQLSHDDGRNRKQA